MRGMITLSLLFVVLLLANPLGAAKEPASSKRTRGSPININIQSALQGLCNGVSEFEGDNCPYYHAYVLATQALNDLPDDGGKGLWTSMWWQAGQGLWYLSEYLHAMEGAQAFDVLYFGLRWAAENTIQTENDYRPTGFTDDSTWWTNGAGRLVQYIQKYRHDSSLPLIKVIQDVVNDNVKNHFDQKCNGGIYWQYGPGINSAKTTISNVLTMNTELTLNNIASNSALVNGSQTSAFGLYKWMIGEGLLNPNTGEEYDNVDPFNNCQMTRWTFNYEYGVLLQALVQLSQTVGDKTYMNHAKVFAQYSFNKWAPNNGVIDDGCDANNCDQTGLAFRGTYVLGLGRYFEASGDSATQNVIRQSWKAMLSHRQGTYYPMGWAKGDSKQLTGDPGTITKLTNLALSVAAIKVFKSMKGSSPNVDGTLQGLLPFIYGNELYRACVCDNFACPFHHAMQCFTDDGHYDAGSGTTWHNNVAGFLVGPSHQLILWTDQGASSPWYTTSVWYNQFVVGSVNVDHE